MNLSMLETKLHIPTRRHKVVQRPRLVEKMDRGVQNKLTLVSASAGFGKTTLVSEWLAVSGRPAAWLSLDERDNDLSRFLSYFFTALNTVNIGIGEGLFSALQSPRPPSIESLLTYVLNEINESGEDFVFVLDDFHVIDNKEINHSINFLLEHLPKQMHLVIITRKDPDLPLARLRVRGELTEIRVADLRFNPTETGEFLNQVMDLELSTKNINDLENRTEGWIAGIQLAAISMKGHKNVPGFIQSFNGSHHFVLDYLVEEVLQQQSERVQTFLLCTSILDSFCGPLCDAVLQDPSASGREILESLERANLFIIPLDNEREWYRYHHLFADLLKKRVNQNSYLHNLDGLNGGVAELHRRASEWYEKSGLEIEAFHHAVEANDFEHAARLAEGKGLPLHTRGGLVPVLNWLGSLSSDMLNARPSLWVMYASALVVAGHLTGIEQKLQAAEDALKGEPLDGNTKDLVGLIASTRAALSLFLITGQSRNDADQKLQDTEASLQIRQLDDKTDELIGLIAPIHTRFNINKQQVQNIITQSQLALKYVRPDNFPVRTATTWMLGRGCHLNGNRDEARRAYTEAITISNKIKSNAITIASTIGLGNLLEGDNNLYSAARSYRQVLKLSSDPPQPVSCDAHLGLARIYYEWNEIYSAEQHVQDCLYLAEKTHIEEPDRYVSCQVLLARIKLAEGDLSAAATLTDKAEQFVVQESLAYLMPEVAAMRLLILLQQNNLVSANHLIKKYALPIFQARVYLAENETSKALDVLQSLQGHLQKMDWKDESFKVMVLQAVAHYMHGEKDMAFQLLTSVLMIGEKGGFIRIFADEGTRMYELLSEAVSQGIMVNYINKILEGFETKQKKNVRSAPFLSPPSQSLIEPLSKRELDVLRLIAQGLSNQEISERLFLSVSTIKGHNQNIFGKLGVKRRTEAVKRANELDLL